MKTITRRTFLTLSAAALALGALSGCGVIRENILFLQSGDKDWNGGGTETLHRQLEKQGSSLRPAWSQALSQEMDSIGEELVAVWEKYSWDGESAKSAAQLAEEAAITAKASGTVLEPYSMPSNGRFYNYMDKLAASIIASGVQCTEYGCTRISGYKGKDYVIGIVK